MLQAGNPARSHRFIQAGAGSCASVCAIRLLGSVRVFDVPMKLLVTSTILIGAISGCAAQPISSQCAHDRNAMLALDERAFDQDLSNGGGGWRRIGNIPGCEAAAADLIAAYAAAHPGSSTMLAWHEGQMRAGAGQYSRAIPLLQAARKDPAMDRAGWNHYVDATVAFLRRDMAALAAARAKLQAVPYQPAEGLPADKRLRGVPRSTRAAGHALSLATQHRSGRRPHRLFRQALLGSI